MINYEDGNKGTNTAHICGRVTSGLKFSHRTYGEIFYTFEVGILRNSGYEDQILVMISERILTDDIVSISNYVEIEGQIRTYNEDIGGHNKLHIVVFAREIMSLATCEDQNEIFLEGFLCKSPVERVSPMGRRICDLMIAVNRMYNKSDYIPCIAWGRNAVFAGTFDIGDKLAIHGRLQSRQYKKKDKDGTVLTKTAYEVSILQLETFADCEKF